MFGWLACHRARRRAEAALQQAAWQRRQLARDIERLAVVAAELVEADGAVATDPVTGWEARLAELATNLSRLASGTASLQVTVLALIPAPFRSDAPHGGPPPKPRSPGGANPADNPRRCGTTPRG